MSILSRCCCFKSVKNGSFASGLYTLVLYIMILTAGSFHVHSVLDDLLLLIFTVIMVCLSALLVITSILLLIGLCGDNTNLMVPWLITLSVTTLLDVSVSLYLFFASAIDPFKAVLFVIDFVICVFNVYGFLCVLSFYQEITLIKSQIKYRNDKQCPPNKEKNYLYNNDKRNGFFNNKDHHNCDDNEQAMAATKGVHNNPKDLKHYLSVKKEYRNELSVITEENSGVFIEPQRKISSDASSGGRTDTSQLMSTHEEWSQSGIKSPIMEDMNNVCDGDGEMHCKPQDTDHNRGTADANNTVIIIAANNE